MIQNKPHLTFFCELPVNALSPFFSNAKLINQLQQLGANLSMGLLDFSNERAEIIQKLTQAGIPVTAWLLLPKEKGYWTSLDTVNETIHCYYEFKEWTAKHQLGWAAIGLDIEPRLERINLLNGHLQNEIPDLINRLFSVRKYRRLECNLNYFINQIHLDGYAVETYNFPFVIEERNAGSKIITRLLGTPALDGDREVLMLYSSFFKSNGDAVLWSYAHQAQAIGLGSTGGGVELEGGEPLPEMSWSNLKHDLLIAHNFNQYLYIFSLEGCVEHGYLDRLVNFNWGEMVQQPIKAGNKITYLRKFLQYILWLFSHPLELILSILTVKLLSKRKR